MTHEAKAKAKAMTRKAKDLTCHAALKPQPLLHCSLLIQVNLENSI